MSDATVGELGIGLPGETPPGTVARVAALAEELGFASFWLNDTPRGDSLAGLHTAAGATRRIRLASGVIPIDRRSGAEIADDVRRLELPDERLVIGIGSGGLSRPLAAVAKEAAELQSTVRARVVIGALGPRMRLLGATESDGVLLNWLTPPIAADTAREIRDAAAAAGRDGRTILYLRTAIDPDAQVALEQQTALYDRIPAYASNFAALGISAIDATISPRDDFSSRLGEYRRSVDEVVLRVVTADASEASYLDFVKRAAEMARPVA
ncbi:LLM class flavin-dependent oxidoreductase [Microbacterium sp. B2969]|uniref:LLM class flavin-dependent oxidoreductase n=1 Tax=Microbacterium alkaliflavum TaxID=3248839 RepID=A0ABW7QDE6_9MICO